MIYSRRYILCQSADQWWVHLRCDSSPQGGRDFLISEYDIVRFAGEADICHASIPAESELEHRKSSLCRLLDAGHMQMSTRILPLSIVGARAASSVHKAHQLLRSIALDSHSL